MGTVNTTVQISSDERALLEARIATEQQQVFKNKAVLLNMGVNIINPLAGSEKSKTWHWEGIGTGAMAVKAKGAARPRSTTPKASKTVTMDGPEYYTEGYDWFDSAHFPSWPVLQNSVRRAAEKYVTKAEARLTRLAVTAAQASSDPGVHSGGNWVQAAATGAVTTAYPATDAGAVAFRDKCAEIAANFMSREESVGMNKIMVTTPYIARRVLTRDAKFMSKDYNPNANLPAGTFGECEGYPVVASKYLADLNNTNYTSDILSKYNVDCTLASGSTKGTPVALFFHYDSSFSPLATVRSLAPTTQVWYETDEDENVAGIKSLEGHDTLHVWCAGGIFCHY